MSNESRLLSATLLDARARSQHSDSQLVLLLGVSPRRLRLAALEASAELGWPLVDLNSDLAARLVELLPDERAGEAWGALQEVVDDASGPEGLVVAGTDILFEPTLGYRPYEALRRMGRRVPIVASWLGRVEDGDVIRSEPGHPEYTRVRLDVPYIAIPPEGEPS